ncbi:MAG: formyl transferase [Proteobacteria bacterium]|nr:formyl transferase [Pseudomonadota bacterium]
MRVTLFLNRDLYCNVVLNQLLPGLASHHVSVFYSENVGRAPDLEALDLLRLIEKDIPYDHVFRIADSPGELLTERHLERALGVSFEPMRDPNHPDSLERIRRLKPEVVVSIRYGRIFKRDFISIPRLGVLNLHSGILPDYRGVMATFRAMAAGADEIGCTLHFIDDPSVDTGPVISEWRRPIDQRQSYFGHVLSLYPPGAGLVVDGLAQLEAGKTLETRPQQRNAGMYFSYPEAPDIEEFEKKGFRLFHPAEYRELLGRYHSA